MIEIHASQVHRWLSCPVSAIQSEMNRKKRRTSMPVGMLVGNMVHAEITGHEYEEPKRVIFDDVTPSADKLKSCCDDIISAFHDECEWKWCVSEKEIKMEQVIRIKEEEIKITGTADMILRHAAGHRAIADLKTGLTPPANVWTQLAVYAWLMKMTGREPYPEKACVFWMKRTRRMVDHNHCYDEKDIDDEFINIGRNSAIRAAKNAVEAEPIYNPSRSNCEWCEKEDCTMRFYNTNPHLF